MLNSRDIDRLRPDVAANCRAVPRGGASGAGHRNRAG